MSLLCFLLVLGCSVFRCGTVMLVGIGLRLRILWTKPCSDIMSLVALIG